jgi:hypothetical protein
MSPFLHQSRAVQDAGHALALQHHAHGRFPSKVTIVTRDHLIDEDILLSACAAGVVGVKELRLDCQDGPWPPFTTCDFLLDMWSLPLAELPFSALGVLDLKGCLLVSSSCPLAFPCLKALQLRMCGMKLCTLQDMIRAAPNLADLRLESLQFWDPSPRGSTPAARWLRLRCPAVTVVVVTNMATSVMDACSLELDTPRLRRFRYTQIIPLDASVSFESPAPDLERVHLEVHSATAMRSIDLSGSLFHARSLKLTVYSIADLRVDYLPVFPNLENLEIEELCGGLYLENHISAAAAVVNLLRSCPAVRELRLKFSWRKFLNSRTADQDQVAAMFDSAECKSYMKGGDDGHDCDWCEVLDVAGLISCGCMLNCFRVSLRRVVVQFDVDALSCFQVWLVKFLAQNGMVLKEVDIDGGGRYDSSWFDRSVARWRMTAAGRRRSLLEKEERVCCCRRPEGLLSLLPASPDPHSPPLWNFEHFPLHRAPRWRPVRRSDLTVPVTARGRRAYFQPPRPRSASCRPPAAFPNHPSKTSWRR